LILASIGVLVAAGAAWAAAIAGTPGADVLRGTPRADRLDGKQGADRLFGLGGNDYLEGGEGNDSLDGGAGDDVFSCGPGRDTVLADWSELVDLDCEIVRRPTRLAPPPSPPPPPPPPGPVASPGRYAGPTSQNEQITFDVTGSTVANIVANTKESCQPAFTLSGETKFLSASIAADGKFSNSFSDTGNAAGETAQYQISIQGSFSGAKATGTFKVDITFDKAGTHYICTSGTVSWNASRS
jgi:Ca2+-binding RTX toxin-like protein